MNQPRHFRNPEISSQGPERPFALSRFFLCACLLVALSLLPTSARAAETSWNGSGTLWGKNGNGPNNNPGTSDVAVFDSNFTGSSQPDTGSSSSAGGIWLKSSVTKNVTIT